MAVFKAVYEIHDEKIGNQRDGQPGKRTYEKAFAGFFNDFHEKVSGARRRGDW